LPPSPFVKVGCGSSSGKDGLASPPFADLAFRGMGASPWMTVFHVHTIYPFSHASLALWNVRCEDLWHGKAGELTVKDRSLGAALLKRQSRNLTPL
jgi:hypothetical protein